MTPRDLVPGGTYSWDQVGSEFGFKPAYLSAAGGMPVSTATDSVLLITHPKGGKAFNYEDYWDGDDLIYTGRGKVGNQERTGPNRDVAENRRTLYAFEAAGPRRLRFLGVPLNVEERRGRAPGDDGAIRTVLQFRLRFPEGHGRRFAADPQAVGAISRRPRNEVAVERRARPFDSSRPPTPATAASTVLEPEEILALQEKAKQAHHELITHLDALLKNARWDEVQEIPAAIDLRGRAPSGQRVIFEGKTITDTNETAQCRGGLAQLLEYRLEYGTPRDLLCLAVDREISLRRARILDSLGVGVVVVSADGWRAVNDCGSAVLAV